MINFNLQTFEGLMKRVWFIIWFPWCSSFLGCGRKKVKHFMSRGSKAFSSTNLKLKWFILIF